VPDKKDIFLKTRLISFLVGVFSIIFLANPALAGEIAVLDEHILASSPDGTDGPDVIFDAEQSRKGGFLLAGQKGYRSAWTEAVSTDLRETWTNTPKLGWRSFVALSLIDAKDGGFWAVGNARAYDTNLLERPGMSFKETEPIIEKATNDYLAKFDAAGKLTWQRPLDQHPRGRAYCLQEAPDGLFLLESRPTVYHDADHIDRPVVLEVPWIAKFDRDSHLVWEKPLSGDRLPLAVSIDALHGIPKTCGGLVVGKQGAITVALPVTVLSNAHADSKGIAIPSLRLDQMENDTLVVTLDTAGNEKQRSIREGSDGAFLFPDPSGFLLVEHLKPPFDFKAARGNVGSMMLGISNVLKSSGVRISKLADDLSSIETHEKKTTNLTTFLTAALPDRFGGFWVSGCNADHESFLVHLDHVGTADFTERMQPNPGNECAKVGLANGLRDDELLVFMGSHAIQNKVLRVRADLR
jgi:hypothetical protein